MGELTAKPEDKIDPCSPQKPTWSTSYYELRLDYWRGRWRRDDENEFRYRGHWLSVSAQERIVAEGRFEEWDFAPGCAPSMVDFVFACDEHSQPAYDMAEVVVAAFCQTEPTLFDFGSIVLFDRLRIEALSANESRAVWHSIRLVLSRIRRTVAAGVILKAFPLEYEGKVTNGNREAFERRQRAMLRHYSRQLGTRTLPGEAGRRGWQWLPIKYSIEPVESQRRP